MNKASFKLIGKEYNDTGQVPKDKDVFYKCGLCQTIIPSLPESKIASCDCGNVHIDLFYWRLAIKDFRGFEVLKQEDG